MTYNRPGRKRYRTPPERQERPEIHNIDMFIVPPPEPTIYMSVINDRRGVEKMPKDTFQVNLPDGMINQNYNPETVKDKTNNKSSLLDKL